MNNDIKEYYQLDDDELDKVIFTQENIDHFWLYQKTLEIVGIVDEVEIRPAASLMKFSLVNKVGTVIQCVVFDADVIETLKNDVQSGYIIHIDGAFVKEKYTNGSNSTINFDLTISTNTKIHLLRQTPKYTPCENVVESMTVTSIEDSVNHFGKIQIVAYLKNPFAIEKLPQNGEYNIATLSDCKQYKLEVRMSDLCKMEEFTMGCHLRLTGSVKFSRCAYFVVANKKDIKLESSERKNVIELLKGNKNPIKRPLQEVTNASPNKLVCLKNEKA